MVNTPPLRWGILGTANIAVKKVIPAMRASSRARVVAIASRDIEKARRAADALDIPRAYGSYQELLADAEVDAIYNPLPNHLHVPWSIRAADAGKHVLCEKPIALNASEARELVEARDRNGVTIAEAFMVRVHPQWLAVRELVRDGRIGELRLVTGHFSYFRRDPNDVRSHVEWGGGVLFDIGCYPINLTRWLFDAEPTGVIATMNRDPDFRVDRLVGALMEFENGQAQFACGGQLVPFQRMTMFCDRGRIEVEIPFNAPPDRRCRILVDDGSRFASESAELIDFPAVDQYTLQADRFADAVAGNAEVAVPLEDALANMAVIDAMFRSAESRRMETP
ncbi:MAG TPA: Gfo/Idh/MocA family oxidoreductase [Gemmatimonadaceae bacterium]|jgi:predicted dehydrogenase